MRYNFDNVAGYDAEKQELMYLCEVFNNSDKYLEMGAKLPKGVVFYGTAGVGKTLFAKVMACECNLNLINIDVSSIDKTSAVCNRIKEAFEKAKKFKGRSMIFFDEIDKFLPNYAEEYVTDQTKTILAQLLTSIDGMNSDGCFVFVATCNNYASMPEALRRPGRMDKKIFLSKPDFKSRCAILKHYLQNVKCEFEPSVETMAQITTGFTGAGIETLVNECLMHSNDGFVCLDMVKRISSEIKNQDISRGVSSRDLAVKACRNIGDFVVAKSFNDGNYTLSIIHDTVCNDFFNGIFSQYDSDYNGFDDDEDDDEDEYGSYNSKFYSKQDFLNAITVVMGGYIAVQKIFGDVYENSQIDLAKDVMFDMLENAMFGWDYYYEEYRNEKMPYSTAYIDRVNELISNVLNDCYAHAERIIGNNVGVIGQLMDILKNDGLISMGDCEKYLADFGGLNLE